MTSRLVSVFLGVGLLAAACGADDAVSSSPPSTGIDGPVDSGATRPIALTRPESTPAVDISIHSVPLDEIVFDTFDGSAVPLSVVDEATIERLFDAIRPLDAPDYETGADADSWLNDDDVVVSFVDAAGDAWAFPVKILNLHEIVNDELAGQPVLVSYCPLCASAVVFDRTLDDRTLSFSNTSALHDNDLVMVDRETGSYWWQVAGRAIVGPETDRSLVPLPSRMRQWSDWRADHPDGAVLARPPGRDYSRDPFADYADFVESGSTPFPVDADALADDRLTPATRVIVSTAGDETRAWPVEPAIDLEDRIGDVAVRVVTDGISGTVTEEATGTELGVRSSFWFAIVAAFPDVTVGAR